MGFLQLSPQVFSALEPCECEEMIAKARYSYIHKFDHELMYIAISNALGSAFSKNYKYNNVFEKKEIKKEVTEEERQRIKEYFENW